MAQKNPENKQHVSSIVTIDHLRPRRLSEDGTENTTNISIPAP